MEPLLPPPRKVSSPFFLPATTSQPLAPAAAAAHHQHPVNITQTTSHSREEEQPGLLPPLSRPDPNNVINTLVRKLTASQPQRGDVTRKDDVIRKSSSSETMENIKENMLNMNISEGLLSSSSSSDKSSSSKNSERLSRKASLKKNTKILQVEKL